MKIKQRYRFFVAFISLFMLLSFIQETYAKYISKASADTNIAIARWGVLINNQDISNDSDFSGTISPIFPGTEHINSNILAPNSEGYFDIVIDATSVDVSFTEIIELSLGTDNTISDLMIVGYSLNGGATIYFENNSTASISKDVLVNDLVRIQSFRVFVKWHDGVNENMDDDSDTLATKNGKATIDAKISLTQKAN